MLVTVDQIQQLFESGILREGEPIELIKGKLVDKEPLGPPRLAYLILSVHAVLDRLAESHGCHAQAQLPVVLNEHNEPEPDCAVVIGKMTDFRTRHPGPADLELVVEISDTSLRYDRTTKQRLYATAGIPADWIVNLRDNTVEVYQEPDSTAGRYLQKSILTEADQISLHLAGTSQPVSVKSLFGR